MLVRNPLRCGAGQFRNRKMAVRGGFLYVHGVGIIAPQGPVAAWRASRRTGDRGTAKSVSLLGAVIGVMLA